MQKIGSWVLLAALAVGTVYFFWFWPGRAALATFSPIRSGGQTLVLDAGHGGEDGGAVSLSGVPESGINLAIVQKLDQLLGLYGEAPLLLRSEDISLHDDSAQTLREKKVSDLHNRVARIEETEHQNTFPDGKYHGAQVFYSNGELSQPLAQLTQETLRDALDPGNTREAKPIPDSVYLMNHITCPAILVECGFLSNGAEAEKLCDAAIRRLSDQAGLRLGRLLAAMAGRGGERGRLFTTKGRRRLRMKAKTLFYCTECGNETPKWSGQCPACRAWNTLVERPAEPKKRSAAAASVAGGGLRGTGNRPRPMREVETTHELRFETGMNELDRVLGGGAVKGSLVLVGGAPGIGKSTLMLQICDNLCRFASVLYVSGEESERQIKLRAERLHVRGEGMYLLAETNLEDVLESVNELKPDVLIVDSIQTLYNGDLTTAPGSVGQVKDCTMALMQLAKGQGITVFVIGHVNKEGSIAGPKVLEHMVDCVLYFEGEQQNSYRILRAAKNRFGATNEIGVFEMEDSGLSEVPNPSEMLLSGRPQDTPGTCVTCVMEGVRPVLAEVQALLAPTSFNVPRRTANGFDFNRANLLLAVLEKRGGLMVSSCDAYINVIGGLFLDEPAADLAMIVALASSFRDKPVSGDLAAIGEVGLTGELRAVSNLGQRLSEVRRLGFTKCLIPKRIQGKLAAPEGLELIRVANIREALAALL